MAEKSQVTGAIGGALSGASAGSAFGPAGTAIGAVVGGIAGAMGGGGENRAMNLARQQAALYRLEGEEQERRLDLERRQAVGTARGLVAASNLQNKYSPVNYTSMLESQYLSDLSFTRLSTSIRERMAMNQGQAAASAIEAGGWSNLLQGATAAATTFGPGIIDYFKPATTSIGGINTTGWSDAERLP